MAKKTESTAKTKYEQALEDLNKTYGAGTVISLGEKKNEVYDVIPTGSLSLDTALGIGGIALGRMYELMGWEGSGKSTICGHLAANAQKKFPDKKVLYIDGEYSIDVLYFKALGVDVDRMMISQPSTGEEGFNVAIKMIETGEISLVIIDSDSSLLPKSVVDGEVGDSAIGKKARLNNNSYPKLKGAISENNVAMVVVSQYREKIGVMFGNPTTTQGGHALKFYSDVRLEVTKTNVKDGDQVYGSKTKVRATKNKMAPPYQTAEFEIVYGKGIDREKEILDLAIEMDIIKKSGSWFSYQNDKLGQGSEAVLQLFNDNEQFYKQIEEQVLLKIKEAA